ncbi:MAG: alanine/glycine:cation symporter family protein, partial [Flammeovirgaceae bacterium]
FTCSLAVMYRERDEEGRYRGGPMYYLTNGLGKKWKPAAVVFCVCCLVGSLPIFQANQLTQLIRDVFLISKNMSSDNLLQFNTIIGTGLAVLVGTVIFGGLKRIAQVAERIVPLMVGIYVVLVFTMMVMNAHKLPDCFMLVLTDAFTGDALLGGALGSLIIIGVKRAAFSNEAGIGTAPLFHGDSKTDNPIKEGLTAMMGPFIDTIVVCTMTAMAILVTDAWTLHELEGISITLEAFTRSFGDLGKVLLFICTFAFSITTLFTSYHFGSKSFYFLTNGKFMNAHLTVYVGAVVFGAIVSIELVINIIDGMYAMMAFPTMIGALLLAPKVMKAAKAYFDQSEEVK